MFYGHFCAQSSLNGPSDLQTYWSEVKDETIFRYAHAEIRTRVVVICDPTRYQLYHGGARIDTKTVVLLLYFMLCYLRWSLWNVSLLSLYSPNPIVHLSHVIVNDSLCVYLYLACPLCNLLCKLILSVSLIPHWGLISKDRGDGHCTSPLFPQIVSNSAI